MQELWQPVRIEDFAHLYEVSNYGRVKRNGSGFLTPYESNGVFYVNLKHKEITRKVAVKRLVANVFIPDIDSRDVIEHIDQNPANNRADNLRACKPNASKKDTSILGSCIGNHTVIDIAPSTPAGDARWVIKCRTCGETRIVRGTQIRAYIRQNKTFSCSVCNRESVREREREKGRIKEGIKESKREYTTYCEKHKLLYFTWQGMKARCYRETHPKYIHYGARGIYVCEAWRNDFKAFCEWSLSNGYRQGLTIDRINNDDGYHPDNCRWTTQKVQQNNKRNNVRH